MAYAVREFSFMEVNMQLHFTSDTKQSVEAIVLEVKKDLPMFGYSIINEGEARFVSYDADGFEVWEIILEVK